MQPRPASGLKLKILLPPHSKCQDCGPLSHIFSDLRMQHIGGMSEVSISSSHSYVTPSPHTNDSFNVCSNRHFCPQWITMYFFPNLTPRNQNLSRKWVNTRQCTDSSVALLKDLVRQQLQRATVHSRFRWQVSLDCMISLPTVGGARVKYYLPLYGSGFWVPKTRVGKELNSINIMIHSSRQSLQNSMKGRMTTLKHQDFQD